MNKICTYVSTTLCTILFFLATAQAQNNGPVQIGFGTSTSLHQPIVVNVHDVAMDPDGDYIYMYNINDYSSQEFSVLSDTTFEYRPALENCGLMTMFIIVCDTSLVYQNSLCDSFWYDIDVECSWPPVVLNSQQPSHIVCDDETVLYAPSTSGGSNAHRITLISSNPNDVFARDPYDTFNTTMGIMTYNGFGERYITITIEDQFSQEVASGIPYTTVNVYPNHSAQLDTNSFYANSVGIIPTNPAPSYWNHTITWMDSYGNVMRSTLVTDQNYNAVKDSAVILSVDTPGIYTVISTNHTTGCVDTASGYFAGMNHPVSDTEIPFVEIFVPSGGVPIVIETYYTGGNEYENDLNNGRIKFTDTVTSPSKGIISYANGDMYYAANNQCGFDTFFAIGCDTSNFLPHTTCDTLMVIIEIECGFHILANTINDVSCFGGNDGVAQVSVSGIDSSLLQYIWSNGVTTAYNGGLSEGYYTVTVSYQGSSTVSSTTIGQPGLLQGTVVEEATCGTSCTGSVVATLGGGTPPYFLQWSNGSTSTTIQNLCSNSYAATVVDANGCMLMINADITEIPSNMAVSFQTQQIDCDNITGSVVATVSNGIAPYTYLWSNGSAQQTVTGLFEGEYTVTITDAAGCEVAATETIINGSDLDIAEVNSVLPRCNNTSDGSMQVAATGGVPPYVYQWSNSASVSDIATNLTAGINVVTVTDNEGCFHVYSFNLGVQYAIMFNDSVTSVDCIPGQIGEIKTQALNGTSPYNYLWSNGATTSTINVMAGTYQLTATDALGCTAVDTLIVSNYSLFLSAYAYPEICDHANGLAKVNAYQGTPPYNYMWNNNAQLNTSILNGVLSGTYNVRVTDSRGCYATASVNVWDDCYATIAGNIFIDDNGNCLRDISEDQMNTQTIVTASNGEHEYYGNVNEYGYYQIIIYETGIYTLSLASSPCYTVCNSPHIAVNMLDAVYTAPQIGITPSPNSHNFSLQISNPGFNPGFNTTYFVAVTSYNNPQNINGSVVLTYDSTLIFVGVAQSGVVDINAHTVTWSNINVSTVPVYSSLVATFKVPVGTALGTQISATAIIHPTSNDCNPQNNSVTVTRPVTGSYDPNMKEVNPATEILETDSVLHYTIHFQNTGNDTTHFVILKDTLSDLVNPASFEFGGSSHQPCRYEISGTGILTFTFDPIYLPDSATNEEGSKGFVSYSIKKKADAPVGEVIRNTAHIYFDFNPAIVTNTTENEVTTLVSIRGVKANGSLTAKVYPNPFNETATIELSEKLTDAKLVITNLAGQVVQQYNSENGSKWQISKQGLSQGMYTFTVYSGGVVKIRGKLIAE